jgi:hypothetical protein
VAVQPRQRVVAPHRPQLLRLAEPARHYQQRALVLPPVFQPNPTWPLFRLILLRRVPLLPALALARFRLLERPQLRVPARRCW